MNLPLAIPLRVTAAGLVVVGAAAVTWMLTAPELTGSVEGEPRAWIDRPLDGVVLALGPVEVVAHAADPDGVGTVRLEVDGQPLAVVEGDGGPLVDVTWTWDPDGPGTYELTAVGEGADGGAGRRGMATVRILESSDDPPESSTSSSSTSIPSPPTSSSSSSSTSTSIPSPPSSPSSSTSSTSLPPTSSGTTSSSSPSTTADACDPTSPDATAQYPAGWFYIFEWTYSGCTPDTFQIQVGGSPSFSTIHREGEVSGEERSWEDLASSYESCAYSSYYWRVRGVSAGHLGPWSDVRTFLECPH